MDKKYPKHSTKSITVHDLPLSERPREKLQELGSDKLSNAELLAIILRSGTKGESVLLTAQRLLSHFGSLEKTTESSFNDLLSFRGLGPAKAAQLLACFELAKRIRYSGIMEHKMKFNVDPITNPVYAVELIRSKINNFCKEQFFILSFDTRNRLLGIDNVSTGTLTASLVHPRETFEAAIRRHAAQIIAAHNHPSGDCEPSEEDMKITKRLTEAGKIMGIEVIDHIIVTKTEYLSFKEKEMM
jgi:DNA repair protein RadC